MLGNRRAVLARELTKINEEYIRGSLEELTSLDEATIKGEIVLLVEGAAETEVSDQEIIKRLQFMLDKGVNKKVAIEIVVDELNVRKNRVYKLAETL